MKADTEEDSGWGVILFTESQKVPKNKGEEWKVKKLLLVKNSHAKP